MLLDFGRWISDDDNPAAQSVGEKGMLPQLGSA